jgi:hypothetical protein
MSQVFAYLYHKGPVGFSGLCAAKELHRQYGKGHKYCDIYAGFEGSFPK